MPDLLRAAHLACRCLIRLQQRTLPVDPLAILRRCRGTQLCTYEQAAERLRMPEDELLRLCGDADAFTVRRERASLVCYRQGGHPARLNFTLAHELGHVLLGHQVNGPAEEAEADCFASHLLCPQPVVQGWPPERIARTCYVSMAAAQRITQRPPLGLNPLLADEVRRLMQDV